MASWMMTSTTAVSSFLLLSFFPLSITASVRVEECGTTWYRHRQHHRVKRIVGGTTARECEFPWMVLVSVNGDSCGGSLVDHSHVVTAAHCLEDLNLKHGLSIFVKGGSSSMEDMQTFPVKSWKIHPHRNSTSLDFDAAVLTLQYPVTFTDCLSPICLPAPNSEATPTAECWAAGWGTLYRQGPHSRHQKKVHLPIVDDKLCKMVFFDAVDETKVCAGDFLRGGKDTCQGDSGGPLMCLTADGHFVLSGIVSFGEGCAEPLHPGVYANVAHPDVLGFILETIKHD